MDFKTVRFIEAQNIYICLCDVYIYIPQKFAKKRMIKICALWQNDIVRNLENL